MLPRHWLTTCQITPGGLIIARFSLVGLGLPSSFARMRLRKGSFWRCNARDHCGACTKFSASSIQRWVTERSRGQHRYLLFLRLRFEHKSTVCRSYITYSITLLIRLVSGFSFSARAGMLGISASILMYDRGTATLFERTTFCLS